MSQILISYTTTLLLMLALVVPHTSRAAQLHDLQRISVPEGLSNDFVSAMATDSYGFVWVGTKNGLNRITNYGIQKFYNTGAQLTGNNITSLYNDRRNNTMWVGTYNGITIINCATGRMRTLTKSDGLAQNAVIDIAPATDGGLWILYMNQGVQHYDTRTNTLQPQDPATRKALSRTAHKCLDNGHGQLYIAYNGTGMAVMDTRTKRITNYRHRDGDQTSLPSDNARALTIDRHGKVWVGTNNGLAVFDNARHTFGRIGHSNGYDVGDNIYDLGITPDGQLLAACNLEGASIIDTRNANGTNLPTANVRRLPDYGTASCVRNVMGDSFGNVWTGYYGTGLGFYNTHAKPFGTLPVGNDGTRAYTYGIAACRDGGLWVGSDSEILLYRDNTMAGRWSFKGELRRQSAFAFALYEDSKGNVWVGFDDEGVVVFNTADKSFHRIELTKHTIDIFAFLELPDGKILIGSETGLYLYSKKGITLLKGMNTKLASPTVYGLATDRQGRIWVGTDGGGVDIFDISGRHVCRLDEKNGLASNTVTQIERAADGSMLVATNNGLCRIADTKHPHKVETFRNGLTDTNVKAVTQDRHGHIWVSTYTNIARLDINNGTFTVFGPNAGIPAGGFVEGAAALTADGMIYFGSPKGVCSVNPTMIERQPNVAPVHIIGCETVAPDMRQMMSISPDNDGTYHMSHDASTIRVSFSVADYGQCGMVDYAYKMEGLDDKWYYTDGNGEVTFRNLKPGKYTFKVKARLLGGQFTTDRTDMIDIVVSPPWWATWWMKLMYTLMAVAAATAAARQYKRKLALENSLKLRDASLEMERLNRQKEQDMNESRLQFYTNMAHELRTPLTLVIGPVDDLRSQTDMPQQCRTKLDMIYHNATRLLGLINRLMEFRKTETGNRTLTVAHGDIVQTVRNTAIRFVEACSGKGLHLKLEVPEDETTIYFDSEVINHILDNLMSNAIKYTPQGGTVKLALTCTDNSVDISVADTGYGIAKDALPHIFERYWQENGKHQASGTA